MNLSNLSVVKDLRKEGNVLGQTASKGTVKSRGDVNYSCDKEGNTKFVFREIFLKETGLDSQFGLDQVSQTGILPQNITEFAFKQGDANTTRYLGNPKRGKNKSKSIVCKNAEYFLINTGLVEKGVEKELYLNKVEDNGNVYFVFAATKGTQSVNQAEETDTNTNSNDEEL